MKYYLVFEVYHNDADDHKLERNDYKWDDVDKD